MITSLPLQDWPAADREAWAAACAPGERLRRGGRAAHLKASTRADYARCYGYFLEVLREQGRLDCSAPAGARVTPGAVDRFLHRARRDWGSVTLAANLFKIRRVAEFIAPGSHMLWLKEIEADLRAVAHPRNRFDRLVETDVLVEAGERLFREAETAQGLSRRKRALMARNGLMVALLALCPIRLGSFAALTLGRSFRQVGEHWWIVLEAEETKTGRVDERPVPAMLNGMISDYLQVHRPTLLKVAAGEEPPAEGPLWINADGGMLSYSGVNLVITQTTQETIGVAVNPHAFRAAAATTAAYRAAAQPGLASALLQHTSRRTTDKHYNRASSMQAGITLREIIRDLRGRVRWDDPSV